MSWIRGFWMGVMFFLDGVLTGVMFFELDFGGFGILEGLELVLFH